ncbi:MAG: hypothetical protein TQ35_0009390 [Candidatus Aramenus sulfurataquae]|jgi:hypothetical protein|uniref:Uncharacterized protein n=2 Tax=Candidatus Aramenus sulfurataquae TaxID=1326980 RepID=A0AAE3FLI6_9CREN|nr:hypothetical protein [Candidatus Aramenus sulfurataquae]
MDLWKVIGEACLITLGAVTDEGCRYLFKIPDTSINIPGFIWGQVITHVVAPLAGKHGWIFKSFGTGMSLNALRTSDTLIGQEIQTVFQPAYQSIVQNTSKFTEEFSFKGLGINTNNTDFSLKKKIIGKTCIH